MTSGVRTWKLLLEEQLNGLYFEVLASCEELKNRAGEFDARKCEVLQQDKQTGRNQGGDDQRSQDLEVVRQLMEARNKLDDEAEEFSRDFVNGDGGTTNDFVKTFLEMKKSVHGRGGKIECVQRLDR